MRKSYNQMGRQLLLAALLFSNLGVFAQDLPAGITKYTSVEGITEYRLENGLRVLLFPDASKPTVTVNITYLVGSRHEGYGEAGMAHLLEHMVFKGSTKHPNIPQELTEHGCWPNGTTWLDRTNYFETFSATEENLRWALDMEADRMVNSFIAKKDLDTEFSVVRNEFEMGENSPQYVLQERVLSSAFLWHNYGKSTIGNRSDIERVPIENLQAFYRRYYQPDNAVLLVAGKIDEAQTIKLVGEYFSGIAKPTRVLANTYTQEPTQDGERSVMLKRTGDTQGVAAAYHVPGGAHPDHPALNVLLDILTNEPSGRLYKALVETKKVAFQYGYTPALHDPGFAYFYAEVRKESSLDSARMVMMKTLDETLQQPISAEEVERAKSKFVSRTESMFRNVDRLGLSLSEYIASGDWRLVFIQRDRMKKVTPEDVTRVAKAYLKPSNRTVGLFIPETNSDRADVPATPDVNDLVKDYKGDQAVSAGEAFDPSPANIDARTKRGQEANGLRYAYLPKSTRGNSVSASLRLRYADEKSLMFKGIIATLTASMLERGTKTRTYQQIKDELDKLKAQVYVYGSGQMTNVGIQTSKPNLLPALAIVMDYLKNPTFPKEEFEKLKQEKLVEIEAQKQEPQSIASNVAGRLMNPYPKGHIWAYATFDEEIEVLKKATVEDVKQFYKDYYGADNATVAIVGDFDEAATAKVIKQGLGAWKALKPYVRVPHLAFANVKAPNQKIQTDDKANAMMVTAVNFELKDDAPDYAPLYMANYILGDGFLNSRLATRIRQKEGLSYGVGSYLNANSVDNWGDFGSYAIYNPENSDKLMQAYKEEIEKITKEGVTSDELKAAKSAIVQSLQVELSQDGVIASKWNTYLAKSLNRTFVYDADFIKKIETLTSEQVNAALRKYVNYDKLTIVQAGDFAKAKQKAAEPQKAGALGGGKN